MTQCRLGGAGQGGGWPGAAGLQAVSARWSNQFIGLEPLGQREAVGTPLAAPPAASEGRDGRWQVRLPSLCGTCGDRGRVLRGRPLPSAIALLSSVPSRSTVSHARPPGACAPRRPARGWAVCGFGMAGKSDTRKSST